MAVEVTRIDGRTWQFALSTAAPPARAFDFVLDFARHGEWETGLIETRLLSGRAGEAGARYVKSYGQRPSGFFSRLFWKPDLVDCVITEVDLGRRIVWQQDPRIFEDSEAAQVFDVRVEPDGRGSWLLLRRQLTSDQAAAMATVATVRAWHQRPLNRMPAEARQRLLEWMAARSGEDLDVVKAGFSASDDEAIGRALSDTAARGPGLTALERLQGILERLG